MADFAARLDAGGNLDGIGLAIRIGDLDRPAQRRRGDADRRARIERGALALEDRMPRDVEEDVEIAGRRAAHAGFALAGEADAGAFVDTRRDIDLQRLGGVDPALAAAIAAWLGDHLADAVASGAGALDDEEALLRANLAHAGAGCTGLGLGARRGARAAARIAGAGDVDGDLGRLAVERVFEADFHVVAQIRATPRAGPAALRRRAAHELAEDILENIGESAEIGRPRMAATAAVLESGMAEPIVGGALLRILQAVIGFADRLELRLVILAPAILVRVIFHRELAIGGLDRPGIGVTRATEQFVIIDLGGHDWPPVPMPSPPRTAVDDRRRPARR